VQPLRAGGGATLSSSAPTTRVGTSKEEKLFVVLHAVSGTATFSEGLSRAAIKLPPPPIEWPATPRREASTRLRTVELLELVTWRSAAMSCVARLGGWSSVELVSIVITTKPCVAMRRPNQASSPVVHGSSDVGQDCRNRRRLLI
jgi:hypothetical protein